MIKNIQNLPEISAKSFWQLFLQVLKEAWHYPPLLIHSSFSRPWRRFSLFVSQQEVECAFHIEQIARVACHFNNAAEELASHQNAEGN